MEISLTPALLCVAEAQTLVMSTPKSWADPGLDRNHSSSKNSFMGYAAEGAEDLGLLKHLGHLENKHQRVAWSSWSIAPLPAAVFQPGFGPGLHAAPHRAVTWDLWDFCTPWVDVKTDQSVE